jgi:hypothetical protein
VAALVRYRGPLAVLLAGQDEVVPAALGRRLHEGHGAGPKRLWVDERATHNTLDWSADAPRWSEIAAFLAEAR